MATGVLLDEVRVTVVWKWRELYRQLVHVFLVHSPPVRVVSKLHLPFLFGSRTQVCHWIPPVDQVNAPVNCGTPTGCFTRSRGVEGGCLRASRVGVCYR